MGLMHFLVHPSNRLSPEAAQRIYFIGPDDIPWRTDVELNDGNLTIARSVSDSGSLCVPWIVAGRGELTIATGTLIERDEPYLLPVELARGKLHRLRNQLADWQALGMIVPDAASVKLRTALDAFAHAATRQNDMQAASEHAEQALGAALDVCDQLADAYTEQMLAARHRQSAKLETLLGANLGDAFPSEAAAQAVQRSFNAAQVSFNWLEVEAEEGRHDWDVYDRLIEWCRASRLKVCGGPLLQLDSRSVPDWLCLWEGDFDNLLSLVGAFTEAAVTRYRGKVHLWNCAARLNSGSVLSLNEEERLRLAVHVVEVVRRIDPDTPVTVSFDQPWAEYLSRHDSDLSPLHVADALVRSGLGLTAVGIELNVGYHPGGSYRYDTLDMSRMLDRWSLLGVPLLVTLTLPSSDGDDPQSHRAARPLPAGNGNGWSPALQAAWAQRNVALMLAKPAVRGVFWSQLNDAQPHDYPHGGLLDLRGRPKPILAVLESQRKAHLA